MKRIKLQMNILMGAAISLCLSAIGNLRAEHFTLKSFLICFVISFAVSMLIGFWIPVKPLADFLIRELGIREHTLGAKCFSALIADLIYTPIITVIMVLTAYIQASGFFVYLMYGRFPKPFSIYLHNFQLIQFQWLLQSLYYN